MRIRNEQLEVFENGAERQFRMDLVNEIKELTPAICNLAGDAAVQKTVDSAMSRARSHGFSLRGPLRSYVQTSAILGCGFDSDPQLPWAAEALNNAPQQDEMLHADRLSLRLGYAERTATKA